MHLKDSITRGPTDACTVLIVRMQRPRTRRRGCHPRAPGVSRGHPAPTARVRSVAARNTPTAPRTRAVCHRPCARRRRCHPRAPGVARGHPAPTARARSSVKHTFALALTQHPRCPSRPMRTTLQVRHPWLPLRFSPTPWCSVMQAAPREDRAQRTPPPAR